MPSFLATGWKIAFVGGAGAADRRPGQEVRFGARTRRVGPARDPDLLPGADCLAQGLPGHHGSVDERLPLLAHASGTVIKNCHENKEIKLLLMKILTKLDD